MRQERSKRKRKRSRIHSLRSTKPVIDGMSRDLLLIHTNHLIVEMIVKKIKKATTK